QSVSEHRNVGRYWTIRCLFGRLERHPLLTTVERKPKPRCTPRRRGFSARFCLDYPAEFPGLVIGYAPCAQCQPLGDCWRLIELARVSPWSVIAVIVVPVSARLRVALIPIAVSRSMFFVPTTRLAAVASWLIAVRARVVARMS